jgi:hypothetical protein
MINSQVLDKAIAAHAAWKARLRKTATTGICDITNTKADNQCDLGKWLYGTELSAQEKQSPHYRTVKQLHADFHKEVARIIDLATSGQKGAAEAAIGMDSKYVEISSTLTSALVKWRDGLEL